MENDYKQELADRFVESIEYLNRQMHTGRLDEWEGLDMTIPQIKTLVLLERMGPLRMGSIAIFLGRALSATTTVVDRLVEKSLVDRVADPDDRRVVICKLTDRGEQAIERFWRIGRERLQLVVDLLDEEQLKLVVQGLDLICSAEKEIQRDVRVDANDRLTCPFTFEKLVKDLTSAGMPAGRIGLRIRVILVNKDRDLRRTTVNHLIHVTRAIKSRCQTMVNSSHSTGVPFVDPLPPLLRIESSGCRDACPLTGCRQREKS